MKDEEKPARGELKCPFCNSTNIEFLRSQIRRCADCNSSWRGDFNAKPRSRRMPRFAAGGDWVGATTRPHERFRTQRGEWKIYSDGGLYARYYEDQKGKRVKVSSLIAEKGTFTPDNADELLAKKMAVVNTVQRGQWETPASTALTISEFFKDAYVPVLREGGIAWSTLRTYERMWPMYCEEYIGDKPVCSFTTADAADFLKKLARRKLRNGKIGLNTSSVKICRSIVRNLFSFARSESLYKGPNPFDDLRIFGIKPRKSEKRIAYSLAETKAVLDAIPAKDTGARLFWMLCSLFTLRPGEAAGCRWEDIDANNILHVKRSCPNGHVQETMKSSSSERLEKLSSAPTVVELLKKHRKHCKGATSGWLFKVRSGNVVNACDMARNHIKPYAKKVIGDRWRGLYAGRRGAITAHRLVTGNSNSGAKSAGHANTRTTDATYTILPDDVAFAGQDAVGAMFEKLGR